MKRGILAAFSLAVAATLIAFFAGVLFADAARAQLERAVAGVPRAGDGSC